MMEKISRKGFLKIAAAAAMSGVTAAGLAACNAASSTVSSATGIYTPGTYTATAKGMSEITATVTFDANTITKVELDLSGETESIGGAAKDKLIEQIMNAQTSQIDGVTGATVTSKAVQNAVADCIQQASGGAINPAQQSTEEASSSADWLGEAPEIAESDIKQTVDCEVLVVGAGSSGSFAAATDISKSFALAIVKSPKKIIGAVSRRPSVFMSVFYIIRSPARFVTAESHGY